MFLYALAERAEIIVPEPPLTSPGASSRPATEEACGEPAGAGGAVRNAFNSLSLHTFAPPRLPPPADAAWAAPFADRPPEESLPCALHAHILGADDQDAHAAVT